MNELKGNLKYREIKLYTNALGTFPLIYDYNKKIKNSTL
jgi:hypothetical protein